jgi:hypothetical protein
MYSNFWSLSTRQAIDFARSEIHEVRKIHKLTGAAADPGFVDASMD